MPLPPCQLSDTSTQLENTINSIITHHHPDAHRGRPRLAELVRWWHCLLLCQHQGSCFLQHHDIPVLKQLSYIWHDPQLDTSTPGAQPNSFRQKKQQPVTTKSSAIAEGQRDVSCQLKSCQLPRNSAETTCTTSVNKSKLWSWRVTMGRCVINMCTQPWCDRVAFIAL